MECANLAKYSWVDLAFSVIGVCTFLVDWGSDIWVATEFYCRGDVLWFAVLVGLMALSSVVVQMFSWFWFQYDREFSGPGGDAPAGGSVLMFGDRVKLSCLLHVLQLGFLCRHFWVIWQGFRVWWRREEGSDYAVYLTHDLSMLRLIETFCESAPQLTLMIYVMLQTNKARTVQFVSIAASTTSMAWMVVDYHRSLRSFVPDKAKQTWSSSLVYFLWNLLLISPRVASLALFSSVLSSFIALHFALLWVVFVAWVWRQKTDFMDSRAGEWLYRATVGLIWYFSWFNVTEGRTRGRSVIYHSFITVDCVILLTTWWLYRDPIESQSYSLGLIISLPLVYISGLLLKTLYYCCFHPKLWRPPQRDPGLPNDLPDSEVTFRDMSAQDRTLSQPLVNKRMALLANNFYSERRELERATTRKKTESHI
ncbi:XK-related protein 8.3 [Boleophthalmus pectinirostris]|uniref:XK-related protein 8.3 n=1 Tax=Boleophthalmus pectinirostris TaxID=150288 RepID=UPI000A1C2119|nr:XK-related protein 8.3 [Boleophthalmus pectinirostris]